MVLIKPMFAPIIAIVLITRYWKTALSAVGAFVAVQPLGFLVPDRHTYYDTVVPYVSIPRPYYNPSIRGLAAQLQVNDTFTIAILAVIALLYISTIILTIPVWKTNHLNWILLVSMITLCGVWLLSPLGQGYYCMFLLPILLLIGTNLSTTHSALFTAAVVSSMYPINFGTYGKNIFLATIIWTLFIVGAMIMIIKQRNDIIEPSNQKEYALEAQTT